MFGYHIPILITLELNRSLKLVDQKMNLYIIRNQVRLINQISKILMVAVDPIYCLEFNRFFGSKFYFYFRVHFYILVNLISHNDN